MTSCLTTVTICLFCNFMCPFNCEYGYASNVRRTHFIDNGTMLNRLKCMTEIFCAYKDHIVSTFCFLCSMTPGNIQLYSLQLEYGDLWLTF